MDIRKYNADAWDAKVKANDQWTRPVDSKVIAEARAGRWQLILTPVIPVPATWYPRHPDLSGLKILALASAGGQQGPVLAAAGAEVTVLDNSAGQLAQDRSVAERENLTLKTIQGDMADLSVFADQSFDLVFHPTSICFVPDPLPVWQEAHRVLKPGGRLLTGIMNPDFYIFDYGIIEKEGRLVVRHRLPYSDLTHLGAEELTGHQAVKEALEFSHSMDTLLGGILAAGFAVKGFFEDRFEEAGDDPVSEFMPVCFAVMAEKTL